MYPVNVTNPSVNGWSAALDFNGPFAIDNNRVRRQATDTGISMRSGAQPAAQSQPRSRSQQPILQPSNGNQLMARSSHNAIKQQRSRNQSTSDVSRGQPTGNSVGGRRSFELKMIKTPGTSPANESRVRTFTGNMDVSGISKTGRIWTFSPNTKLLSPENLKNEQEILLMAIWDGISKEEIEQAKNATILYFDSPVKDASCLVDRF